MYHLTHNGRLIIFICWLQLLIIPNFANAFCTNQQASFAKTYHGSPPRNYDSKLYGISEWREKFNPSITAESKDDVNNTTLPLLLLPFTPSEIILPGQSTTLEFRHGKYIDIIDEAITSYESVVGLSILGDDGLLPYVVLCEVIEEEFVMKMGYRGFSSIQVGVRAVGRAIRQTANISGENKGEEEEGAKFVIRDDTSGKNIAFPRGRMKNTAQDDIHLGQFIEWDDDLMDSDELDIAYEYLDSIQGTLGLSSTASLQKQQCTDTPELDDRIQRQQELYTKAYEIILEQSNNHTSPTLARYSNKQQQEQHSKLLAASWGALVSVIEESDARSSSVITQVLETRNVVERLRLGLAMMLDSQMPGHDIVAGGPKASSSGDIQENAFQ